MHAGSVDSFQSLSHEFDNFDEFNQSIRGWSTAFRQVDRGIATVMLRQRMTPLINALDVQFTHSTASVGTTQPGHRTFGIVGKDNGCTWCGHDVFSNQILRFDAHDEFFTFTPREFIGRTLSIDENLLSRVSETLKYHDLLDELDRSGDVLTLDPAAVRRFRRLYDKTLHCEKDLLEVVESLVVLIGENREEKSDSWQRNASRVVDQALDFITMHAREAITVADVCASLDVGYRRLDRAFKRQLGHGPKDSILACRLSGARAELRLAEASASVADIANAWGFWHLGDFARIYRREFGELPSESLRR